MAEAQESLSPPRKEHFTLNLFYLKDGKSLGGFINNLPDGVKVINAGNPTRDESNAYAENDIRCTLTIESSLGKELVNTVLELWEKYIHEKEYMSWIQVLPTKRVSYKKPVMLNGENIEIYGGSMVSPVHFVKHWHVEASLEFQQEKSLLVITTSKIRIEFNITKDYIHDFVPIDKKDSETFVYLYMRYSPKLFKVVSGNELRKIRIPASETGFAKFGYLDCFCLKLATNSPILSRLFWYTQYKDIHVVYANMRFQNPTKEIEPKFEEFEDAYAWKSLCSLGNKVRDHVSQKVIDELYQRKVTEQVLFKMMESVAEKPFFHFIEEICAAMRKIDPTCIDHDNGTSIPKNYSMIRRVLLTPSKFVFMPKEPVFQNRIVRQYDEDFFVRLVYRDNNFEKISAMQSNTLNSVLTEMKEIFVKGFSIHDRHYEFLGCSNSQLREHSFWFFSSYDGITTDIIRQKAGELYKERCVASYVSRFGLCFSSSSHVLNIGENGEEVKYESDVIRSRFCFTDGIGKISERLATKVAGIMGLKAVPSAFQIRYGGCKGVVAQDPSLGTEREVLVIRESMKKFESSSTSLEILQFSRPGQLHLNRQVITLLSGLGIQDETFKELQETMLYNLADMFLKEDKALMSLKELALPTDFKNLINQNMSIVREPFLRSLLLAIFEQRVEDLKRRSRIQIPLEKGRYMMGTTDESKTLKYGQVFIQYSKELDQPLKDVQMVLGKVVVTKNPCFHPGDLRIFEAVDNTHLRHMVDCIVFPQLGLRPHPDEMSGSDLDGDEYFVCWDERFHGIENQDPMDFQKAKKTYLDSDVQLTHIVDFLANYIKNDNLGIIANAHLALADSEQGGIFSDLCLKLAKKHSDAVDFPKSGKCPQIDTDVRPKRYPDFMMKSDKLPYYSSKVLGKLFRQCQQLHGTTQRHKTIHEKLIIDNDFVLSLKEKDTEDAILQRDLYNDKLLEIMTEFGLKKESEAITALIQTLKHGRGFLKNEKFQIGKIVQEKIAILWKKTRAIFFEEFGGEERKSDLLEPMIRKASAWYTATYKNKTRSTQQLLSFPWVVADILSLLKQDKKQVNVLEEVENSFERRMNQSEKDRMYTLKCHQSLRNVVEQNRPPNLHLQWIVLCGHDIVLPGNNNQYLGVKMEDFELVVSTIQSSPSSALLTNTNELCEKLCFLLKLEDNVDGFITIITDDSIVNKSKAINEDLENYPSVKYVVQFLLEEFWDWSIPGTSFDVIKYMLPLLLVRQSNIEHFVSRKNVKAAILFDCLKNVRDFLQNIVASSDLPNSALHWLVKNTEDIVRKCMLKYIEISLSFSVETHGDSEEEQFAVSEPILVPTEFWSAVEYAEPYMEFNLREQTGADAFIYFEDSGKSKILKLEAIGTTLQLEQIHKTLFEISTNTFNKRFIHANCGQSSVHEALTIFFEGSKQDDDTIAFEDYRGPSQDRHKRKPKYLPVLRSYNDTDDGKAFQTAFRRQWRKIRSDYNDVFHGGLYIALVFGSFYVMDIDKIPLTISELTEYLRTFEQRRGYGNEKKYVSYTCSFLPMYEKAKKLKKILSKFIQVEKKVRVKVRIRNEGFFDLDEHLEILRHNAPELKWFIGQIIRRSSSSSDNSKAGLFNARCKIQSYRTLTRKALNEIEKYEKVLNSRRPLIQRQGNGFCACSDLVTYIREKETTIYSNRNLHLEEKVWRTMQFKVSRVKEYNVETQTRRCKKISDRTELAITPYIPDLSSSDDEIDKYSKHLWDVALYFSKAFDG